MCLYNPWRLIGAWAAETYRGNPSGDFKGGGHSSRLAAAGLPLLYNDGNPKL